MRNFFLLLIRIHALLLFVVLEIVCLILLFNNKEYHRSAFINSSNSVSGKIFTAYSNFTDYLNLKNENERLARENAELRNHLLSSKLDTSTQRILVNDSTHKQMYEYIPAKVVDLTTSKVNNYFTINKGKLQGVDVLMAVIGPNGIVGKIKDITDDYATIIPVLNREFHVSARVGSGNLGSISWNGYSPEYVQLDEIPKQIKISVGDKIYTSGESHKFPENILIGTISSFTPNTSDNFYDIEVKLSTDFRSISYVYVVNNLMRAEQDTLEQHLQNDN
ncbi:MAG TPA: rod shape-determining protein MreC [Bacteroidetes bacterium]|nr:rod shape-determining protein MreC [Bacteroidota bacterium]